MSTLTRRQFLPFICAPAIIRVADIMRIKEPRGDYTFSCYVRGETDRFGVNFADPGACLDGRDTMTISYEGGGWYRIQQQIFDVTQSSALRRVSVPSEGVMAQLELHRRS